MTPNFALSLSFEGIRLLHRVTGGWELVGEVALDDPDMAVVLDDLKTKAAILDERPLRTKVLIPNDQIKYLALDDLRAGEDEVLAALEGATPYSLDELQIDFCRGPEQTFVAAVAKETLQEAEAFADTYGFNPVCFAAVPAAGTYVGEPFFGRTDVALEILGKGHPVERDSQPVQVIGLAQFPEPKPVEEAAADQAVPQPLPDASPDIPAPEADPEPVPDLTTTDTPAPVFSSRAKATLTARAEPVLDRAAVMPKLTATSRITPIVQSPQTRDSLAALVPQQPVATPSEAKATPRIDGLLRPQPAEPEFAKDDAPPALTIKLAPGTQPPAQPPAPVPTKTTVALDQQSSQVAQTLTAAASEQDRMTVFGARKTGTPWRPKYLGLILTAALILFMLAVAALAISGNGLAWLFGGSQDTQVALEAPATDLAAPEEEAAADLAEVEGFDAALVESGVIDPANGLAILPPATETPVETAVAPTQAAPLGQVLTPAEAERLYAATGVWQRAPRLPIMPRVESADDITIAAIDPVTTGTDAVALPGTEAMQPDLSIPLQVPPPAAGIVYPKDERGFILATPEGTLLPNGVTVYLARAESAPPLRPGSENPAVAPDPADRPDGAEDTILSVAPTPFDGLRPRFRPDDMQTQIERSLLGGRTLSELANRPPRSRPDDLAPPTPPVDTSAIDAAVAAAASSGASLANGLVTPTPAARPGDFEQLVGAAQSASIQPSAVAEPEPEADAEPEPTFTAPAGNVPGGVAEAATDKNVIAMRDVSLLGLAGGANNPVAIVRMGNGRVVTVRVGDTLDGGQVSAIGQGGLTYVKRGRTIQLRMP